MVGIEIPIAVCGRFMCVSVQKNHSRSNLKENECNE